MSLRTTCTRLAVTLAAGSLVALAGATPSLADDDWEPAQNPSSSPANTGRDDNGSGTGAGTGRDDNGSTATPGRDQNDAQPGNGDTGTAPNTGTANGHSNSNSNSNSAHGDQHEDDNAVYRGRITARGGLVLRSAPTQRSAVIRTAHHGEIVNIYCKAPGQRVDGNPLWYLLTDGTWAWGSARYIDNVGPAPRWC
ncbi:SH3 domain-containing protein [Streptomyces sp. NPDC008313]|uniref:SH3 domain-containing protein n=1 Tax=Streptomyces sp. NPDC008313 TaxID=3364826 RepID=UPI0036EA23F4